MFALINQKESLTTQLFLKLGANAAGINARLEDELDKLPRVEGVLEPRSEMQFFYSN